MVQNSVFNFSNNLHATSTNYYQMASLLDTRLGDLVQGQHLISVSQNDTVATAMEKLAKHRILCAPVLDDSNTRLLGFVDVLDMVSFLVQQCTKLLTDTRVGESKSLTSDDLTMMRKRTKDFKMSAVTEVINRSRLNPSFQLPADSNIMEAIQSYLKGVHRIAVTDENARPLGMVSQCTILQKIVQQNDALLQDMMKKKVTETPFRSDKCETILSTESTINALLMMQSRKLSDLAIVDNQGKLVGVISASDIKCLLEGDFQKLLEPVHQFIGDIRRRQGKPEKFCVRCLPNESVGEAVRKMVDNKVHRVVLINEQNVPIGVISMTDVMRGSLKPAPITA